MFIPGSSRGEVLSQTTCVQVSIGYALLYKCWQPSYMLCTFAVKHNPTFALLVVQVYQCRTKSFMNVRVQELKGVYVKTMVTKN